MSLLSSATSTPTTASSPTAAASSTATNDKESSSSTRYKDIGIGIGIGVSVPLISIAGVGLIWRRRRRHRHQNASVGLSRFTDSNQQTPLPFQEHGHEEYADNIDRRAAEARSYELDSLKNPAELIGSEPDTSNLNAYGSRPLRPSSIGKQD
ncbi:uncharacterized protein M437DRAFT_69968 [Aureobasidium melanogenum CBS 110374]|uniref:Mid2 domain-containing protein n=1 Tax=Aureobasidium melanogenum (strain CBS 110374) TaxID=1043003 RepID=A0A074W793_AURM1|nr:uncharacterized protein M437DRAFT_69968 [Aureobasidium melanogenum CBS 110374]KEQ58446.1 hypothetical protein M437DRAFT_69968 [Aureobasidium melanogenum CBS 110374]